MGRMTCCRRLTFGSGVPDVDEIARQIVAHVPTYPISHVCQLEDTDAIPRADLLEPYRRAAEDRARFLETGQITEAVGGRVPAGWT